MPQRLALTEQKARQLRKDYEKGDATYEDLADKYRVSMSVVRHVVLQKGAYQKTK